MQIQHILNTKGRRVFTIRPQQSVREALELFIEHNIGSLVVVDDASQPIGMLSERDIVRAAFAHDVIGGLAVAGLMRQEVITATPDADLSAVAHTMTEKRTRHVVVLSHDGQLLGIVSVGDIVKAQRDQFEGALDTLEIQLLSADA